MVAGFCANYKNIYRFKFRNFRFQSPCSCLFLITFAFKLCKARSLFLKRKKKRSPILILKLIWSMTNAATIIDHNLCYSIIISGTVKSLCGPLFIKAIPYKALSVISPQ